MAKKSQKTVTMDGVTMITRVTRDDDLPWLDKPGGGELKLWGGQNHPLVVKTTT